MKDLDTLRVDNAARINAMEGDIDYSMFVSLRLETFIEFMYPQNTHLRAILDYNFESAINSLLIAETETDDNLG